jgi:hypothetical protein
MLYCVTREVGTSKESIEDVPAEAMLGKSVRITRSLFRQQNYHLHRLPRVLVLGCVKVSPSSSIPTVKLLSAPVRSAGGKRRAQCFVAVPLPFGEPLLGTTEL